MYMCFEEDDKRTAVPEHSLVNLDENGFTIRAMAPGNKEMMFLKLASYQGCVQNFTQALNWIKKKPKPAATTGGFEITNAAGDSIAGGPARPPRPASPSQVPPKLPEAPSF